jgi:hypothetical protein
MLAFVAIVSPLENSTVYYYYYYGPLIELCLLRVGKRTHARLRGHVSNL